MTQSIGLVFPGQGSQSVGMGQDVVNTFPETAALFEQASEALGFDLKHICFEGPKEALTQTDKAQPGIFTVSAIILSQLQKAGIVPSLLAGHSLGELTAYYAAGVLSFEDTINTIKVRGQAMAEAAPSGTSGMAAVMGKSLDDVKSLIHAYANAPVVAANINCPGQIVISGEKNSLEKACATIKESGGKVIPLPVSGAFHSPLMQPASDTLGTFVQDISFNTATSPIVLNRTATPESDPEQLKNNLSQQVISSVQWIDTITYMSNHVDTFIECGPGKVLTGLIKKINPDATVITVSSVDQLQTCIDIVKE